jgi:hypothetical protein
MLEVLHCEIMKRNGLFRTEQDITFLQHGFKQAGPTGSQASQKGE